MAGQLSGQRDDPAARHRQSQALRRLNAVDTAERARKGPDSAAIPTRLNSADIGTKNLPKKRLRGVQFMLHMVDAVGDRVGEQEFREIEEQRRMKQGMKKFGKSKDLRIGLLMLLATINKVDSTSTEVKETEEETTWTWLMLCTFACTGALSLINWLRNYINEFLEGTKAFIKETVKAMPRINVIGISVQVERADKETQVSVPNARLEKELEEATNECFLKGLYIEELEQGLEKVKVYLKEFFKEREIAEKYSKKLEERLHSLKMTQSGRVLHFSPTCQRFAAAQNVRLCHTCLTEGGVSETHRGAIS